MTHTLKYGTNEPVYNAGNFQEYHYELEHMECEWKIIYGTFNLVTAFTYPWIQIRY